MASLPIARQIRTFGRNRRDPPEAIGRSGTSWRLILCGGPATQLPRYSGLASRSPRAKQVSSRATRLSRGSAPRPPGAPAGALLLSQVSAPQLRCRAPTLSHESPCRVAAGLLYHEGDRLQRRGVSDVVYKAAERVGLHKPESKRMEEHFSPHCTRHWFTTHLRRAGMRREFIQELRGDARREAIDIYDHIDLKELKEAYLACIPQLGI